MPDRPASPPEAPREPEARDLPFNEENREIARAALGVLFGIASGGRFREDDIAMVAACAHAAGGNRDAKLQTLRDAIEGARRVSKRPPTVRFVFGTTGHFLAHSERGRHQRFGNGKPEPARRTPDRSASAPSPERLTVEQMRADMIKLFGPGYAESERSRK